MNSYNEWGFVDVTGSGSVVEWSFLFWSFNSVSPCFDPCRCCPLSGRDTEGTKKNIQPRCVLVKLGQAEAAGSVAKDNYAVKLLEKSFCVQSLCDSRRERVERVIATKTETIISPHRYTNGARRWFGIKLTLQICMSWMIFSWFCLRKRKWIHQKQKILILLEFHPLTASSVVNLFPLIIV